MRLGKLQAERRVLDGAAAAVRERLAVVQGRLAAALQGGEGLGAPAGTVPTAPTAPAPACSVVPSGAPLPGSGLTVLSYNVLLPNSVDGWCEPLPPHLASPRIPHVCRLRFMSFSLFRTQCTLPSLSREDQGYTSTTSLQPRPPTRCGRIGSGYSRTRSSATALPRRPTWFVCRR